MIKSTSLLTVALFFTIAPSPDTGVLSEITGGFIKADNSAHVRAPEFNSALQSTYVDMQPTFKISAGL